jgi:uncharacterized protein
VTVSGQSVRRAVGGTGRTVARGLIFLIELYRHMISPLRPASCRFMPTCSQYAVDALNEYGAIRGSWLTATRLLKCGPWHPGGWDPIPERHTCQGEAKQGERESFVL